MKNQVMAKVTLIIFGVFVGLATHSLLQGCNPIQPARQQSQDGHGGETSGGFDCQCPEPVHVNLPTVPVGGTAGWLKLPNTAGLLIDADRLEVHRQDQGLTLSGTVVVLNDKVSYTYSLSAEYALKP